MQPLPLPKPIQSKIKYRRHFLTSGEMPEISRVRLKHSSIVAHAAECPLLGVKRTFLQLTAMSAIDPKRT